jgi:hypothetical protein
MISLGLNILHCPSNVVAVMTIWKWSLSQTILDGHSLRQFLIPYNENHILVVDEEGEIGVRKKQYMFIRRNKGYVILKPLFQGLKSFNPMNLFRMLVLHYVAHGITINIFFMKRPCC